MILEDILYNLENLSDRIAYKDKTQSYTYSQLNVYVKNIYKYLESIKETINVRKFNVVIYGHKNIYMLSSIIACALSNLTYVPVDVSFPEHRINEIILQSKAILLINTEDINLNIINDIKIINKNELIEVVKEEHVQDIEVKIITQQEDVFYIMFTSGSTGVPKGVQITYKNINNFVYWLKNNVIKEKYLKVLNQALFSFDLSIADMYYTLLNGSEYIVLEKEIISNLNLLLNYIKNVEPDFIVSTPAFIELLLLESEFNENFIPNLKCIFLCGDVLTYKEAKQIKEKFSQVRLINSYGPTECTVAVSAVEITEYMLQEKNIPIGKVMLNSNIFIVDENLNILPEFQCGQILICGECVAKGYINQKSNNFIEFNKKKAYLTGDIGYFNNKLLYYKYRNDRQIKYNGYRIELDEIQIELENLKYVEKAIVLAKKDTNSRIINLKAYVKLIKKFQNDEIILVRFLKSCLAENLPKYMIPNIKIVEIFKLNSNYKYDIKSLEGE